MLTQLCDLESVEKHKGKTGREVKIGKTGNNYEIRLSGIILKLIILWVSNYQTCIYYKMNMVEF